MLSTSVLDERKYREFYREKIKPLTNGGLRVTLNSNPEAVLEQLKTQSRVGQDSNTNRYYHREGPNGGESPTLIAMRERIRDGAAFTLELWDAQGQLIASTVVMRAGNSFTPDTIGYLPDPVLYYVSSEDGMLVRIQPDQVKSFEEAGQKVRRLQPVDGARMLVYIFLKMLRERGVDAIDTGMVSHFTASLGGRYETRDFFMNWQTRTVQATPIALPEAGSVLLPAEPMRGTANSN